MQLLKVLSSDKAILIRAMYAEDQALLSSFDTNAALALDLAVAAALALFYSDTRFYKIELSDGTLMGWMAISPEENALNAWYIRLQCRTPSLLADFNTLVQQTFSYGLFNSTGVNNIDPLLLNLQTLQQITVTPLDYTGKNMLILRASN
jgi:hypothetical protein